MEKLDKYLQLKNTDSEKMFVLKNIINYLIDKEGLIIQIDRIMKVAAEIKLPKDDVEWLMEQLKKEGEIFESRIGFIQKI